MQKQITVTVESSIYDLMVALTSVVAAVKAASAAGVAAEAEAGVVAAVASLSPIIGELQTIKADLLEDHDAFYRGALLGVEGLGSVILK